MSQLTIDLEQKLSEKKLMRENFSKYIYQKKERIKEYILNFDPCPDIDPEVEINFNHLIGFPLKTKYESLFFKCLEIGRNTEINFDTLDDDYWIVCGPELMSIFLTLPTFNVVGHESEGRLRYIGNIQILDFVIHFVQNESQLNDAFFIGREGYCVRVLMKNLDV